MGVHVVVVYRPRPGQQEALVQETMGHVPLLRQLGFATDHPSTVLRAADGAVVELFEWVSQEAIDSAHQQPEVLAMWARYELCCEYGTLADLPNANTMFAEFELVGTF